jgi:AraC-like DNA-binding protein
MKDNISVERRIGFNREASSPHFHFSCEMIYVEEGFLVMNVEGVSSVINENQLLIISSLEKHTLEKASSDCIRYIFRFSSDFLFESVKDPSLIIIFNRSSALCVPVFDIPNDKLDTIKELFSLLLIEYRNKEYFYKNRLSVLLSAILITLYRIDSTMFNKSNNPLVKKIYEIQIYLNKNYQTNITLEELSSKFSISKSYLEHSFVEITGISVKRYILKTRLTNAKTLLCSSDHNVSTISDMLGFYDSNYFIKQFKKSEDITPLQYRKKYFYSKT